MLVLRGLTNKEIGTILYVCEKTIKFHMGNIYIKSYTKNRAGFISRMLS